MGTEGCGTGDKDIGYSIMMQLLEALPVSEDKPITIVMWNTAVNLMAEDSPALSSLKKLEEKGVKILAGRLCASELCIEDKIAVGQIASMDEILKIILNNEVISL
jgi:intracellular sulfur oxidation DsrE/DsrF family protein